MFGCGNRQWARTYQAIPRRVDSALTAAGAEALRPRGETDAGGDFFGAFDSWYETLWADIGKALGREVADSAPAPAFEVEVLQAGRERALQLHELEQGVVVENRELVNMGHAGARSKRHLQIALPEGMRYKSGDYLSVLPRNPEAIVARALARFGLASDTQIVIHRQPGAAASLPGDYPVAAYEVLSGYVELAQPVTRAQVAQLAEAAPCPPERKELERLAAEQTYADEVLDERVSLLELLGGLITATSAWPASSACCRRCGRAGVRSPRRRWPTRRRPA